MNRLSSTVSRSIWLVGLAILSLSARVVAATPAELGLQLYAGLSVSGTVGAVYQIQYTTNLAQADDPAAWRCLEFLQLRAPTTFWTDNSVPASGRRFYRAVQQSPLTNMVFIPPGTYLRGSQTNEWLPQPDEIPQTVVTISRGFWMGKFEVTQREFLEVQATNPSSFTGDLSRPVESVSWIDATNFCANLTERDLAAGRIPPGTLYRLPTEAEWEYAARAWTSTRFGYGDDPDTTALTNYAWYGDNSGFKSHPVGQKRPNPWGLYDITGNVWEWCQDWYSAYPGGFQIDPRGPAESTGVGWGSFKVMRGGAFDYSASDCRSARRLIFAPNLVDYDLGFRVVLAPNPL